MFRSQSLSCPPLGTTKILGLRYPYWDRGGNVQVSKSVLPSPRNHQNTWSALSLLGQGRHQNARGYGCEMFRSQSLSCRPLGTTKILGLRYPYWDRLRVRNVQVSKSVLPSPRNHQNTWSALSLLGQGRCQNCKVEQKFQNCR